MAVFGESNTALEGIRLVLVKAFKDIGENVRKELIEQYRMGARSRFDKWVLMFEKGAGVIDDYRDRYRPFRGWQSYVAVKSDAHWSVNTWEEARKHFSEPHVRYDEADKSANFAYENARDSFIEKNLGKLREILGKRTDVKNAKIEFRYGRGAFVGNMDIQLSNASIKGELSLKYVVRHIPKTTPYFQYPLVFTSAVVDGKRLTRPSEEELRNLLSGKTSEQHEQERQAERLASGICPGSGQDVPSAVWAKIHMMYVKSATCPVCKQVVGVPHGKFRQHKTGAAVKAAEASKLSEAGYCPMSKQKVPAEIVSAMGPVEPYKDPKGFCPSCKQQVRLDAEKHWIFEGVPEGGHATQMRVESARYYKHKTP